MEERKKEWNAQSGFRNKKEQELFWIKWAITAASLSPDKNNPNREYLRRIARK